MDHITRRNLLKTLAAAPLVSALKPLENAVSKTSQPTADVCLWFHGLFAFVVKHDYIAVITPKVEEHQYLAGLWKQEQKIREGEWYRLSGVSDDAHPNPRPALPADKALVIPAAQGVNMDDSYFLMRLPFPTQMIPLRYASASFSGRQAPRQRAISTFPTVQIMRYKVVDYSNLRLDPFKPWISQKKPPPIIHFHIFAEPNFMVHPDHAMKAFEGMMKLLPGIDLELAQTSDRCFPLDTNLPAGIDGKQQISLAERAGACDHPTGSRTGNCFMIIIDDGP